MVTVGFHPALTGANEKANRESTAAVVAYSEAEAFEFAFHASKSFCAHTANELHEKASSIPGAIVMNDGGGATSDRSGIKNGNVVEDAAVTDGGGAAGAAVVADGGGGTVVGAAVGGDATGGKVCATRVEERSTVVEVEESAGAEESLESTDSSPPS